MQLTELRRIIHLSLKTLEAAMGDARTGYPSAFDRFFVFILALLMAVGIRALGEVHTMLDKVTSKQQIVDERLSQLDVTTTANSAEIRHLSKAVYEGDYP
jgi:hypothetical protein